MNIYLIGFMGSGKTTLGRELAKALDYNFFDTDEAIEMRRQCSINEIFANEGEEYFRDLETRIVKDLWEEAAESKKNKEKKIRGKVVSVGGGLPVREENRRYMREAGLVIYLSAGIDELVKRLSNDTTRPLLANADGETGLREKISTLMQKREDIYENAADFTLVTEDKAINDCIDEIIAYKDALEERKNMKILVINGPNLNFLGIREPGIYGNDNYDSLIAMIEEHAKEIGAEVECYQSNHEGAIIDKIQESYFNGTKGIVINPGAYTHYSYAIRDALASVADIIKIEIHISDVNSREEFRHISVTEPVCQGQIVGHGLAGYLEGMDRIVELCREK